MGVLGKIRSSLGGGPSGEARANTLLGEALAARHRGDLDTAVTRLHQAIAIAPHLPEPHFWLGRCQLRQNQDEQAAKSLSAALKRAPAYPLALHCQVFLAVAHSRLNLALPAVAVAPAQFQLLDVVPRDELVFLGEVVHFCRAFHSW